MIRNSKLVSFLFLFLISVFLPQSARASMNPLSVPNNKFGVHILDVKEIDDAAKLVNSNGGKWGYVTIAMMSNDRDRLKWTSFFKRCRELSVIPIIRLATYAQGDKWVAPTAYDLVDFANFLDQMPWPIENRYIILFNEPNHSKEWGGFIDPVQYATLLVQANQIFKPRSQEYFLLSAGLDMSAPNNHTSLDALNYYRKMTSSVPNWGSLVDGFSFHSYPNPAFLAPYNSKGRFGLQSYKYEISTLKGLGITPKHYFITETGTLRKSDFYKPAFTEIWTDPEIVTVTPFLLFAGAGDFMGFSLLDSNYQPSQNYKDIFSLPKIAGSPLLNIEVLTGISNIPNISISNTTSSPQIIDKFVSTISHFFTRNEPQIILGNKKISIEVSDTEEQRQLGLSDRQSLRDDHGMLFVFPDSILRTFWMNRMNFALDIIWIDNGKIVEISKNIPPPSQSSNNPVKVNSSFPARLVLEVNASFADQNGLKIGDTVNLINYANNPR